MVTLTFGEEQWAWGVVTKEAGKFGDRLCHALRRHRMVGPDERLKYVWTIELHPNGHGLHVHLLVDRFIPQALLSRVWGHGMVDVRRFRGRGSRREDARAAARYLTKGFRYSKEWLREQGVVVSDGAHRYATARGFLPRVVRRVHETVLRAWEWFMQRVRGEVPIHQFLSADVPGWRGPPVLLLRWR